MLVLNKFISTETLLMPIKSSEANIVIKFPFCNEINKSIFIADINVSLNTLMLCSGN